MIQFLIEYRFLPDSAFLPWFKESWINSYLGWQPHDIAIAGNAVWAISAIFACVLIGHFIRGNTKPVEAPMEKTGEASWQAAYRRNRSADLAPSKKNEFELTLALVLRAVALLAFMAVVWTAMYAIGSTFRVPDFTAAPDLLVTTMGALAGFFGVLRYRIPYGPEYE